MLEGPSCYQGSSNPLGILLGNKAHRTKPNYNYKNIVINQVHSEYVAKYVAKYTHIQSPTPTVELNQHCKTKSSVYFNNNAIFLASPGTARCEVYT